MNLFVAETYSIGSGYQLLSNLESQFGKQGFGPLVEASWLPSGRFQILAKVESAGASAVLEFVNQQTQIFSVGVVESGAKTDTLLEFFYGLKKTKCLESLLVVESASLPTVFEMANQVLSGGSVQILELKSSRGLSGKSLLLLTGSSSVLSEIMKKNEKVVAAEMTLISQASESVKSHFNL